jgi:CheY-like chemotaxis protein
LVGEAMTSKTSNGSGNHHEYREVLLVEDNPADVTLFQMAFPPAKKVRVWNVCTGRKALDFLHRVGEFTQAPRPDLIFLDLNLPVIDGREVLETVKADDNLRRIPVVVLSTSNSRADVSASYHRGANSYLVKPADVDSLFRMMDVCCDYWFRTVILDET